MNYRTNDNLTASQVVSTILLCFIFLPLGLLHYYMCKRQNRKAMMQNPAAQSDVELDALKKQVEAAELRRRLAELEAK